MTSTSPKTLAVLQPGYMPWLGFFDQMRRSDIFVYYDDVQFDKHGWRNRNRVKAPTGPLWLTVPVRHHGKPPILEVEIDERAPWARRHTGTIRQFYARAPFLDRYIDQLEELLVRPWTKLVDLDLAVASRMAEWLGVRTQIERSSCLGIEGERSERLVRICERFGATRYLSGNAAQTYLDVGLFAGSGIEVVWQDFRHPTYPQQHGDFVPYLSAMDLLLNCGERSAAILAGEEEAA
jgi:WbqC-like protein